MKLFVAIPLLIIGFCAALFVCAWLFQWIWGLALVPFGLPAITFWQAVGLWLLLVIVWNFFRSKGK